MNYSSLYYYNIFLYDFLLQSPVKNVYQLPKFTKIYLNLGLKGKSVSNSKNFIFLFGILFFLTNQKPQKKESTKNILSFNIKKGNITGCSLVLKKKALYSFLDKLFFFIFTRKEKIFFSSKNHFLNFQIKYLDDFFEFETESSINQFGPLDISLHTNCQNKKEHFLLFNNFQYPIKKR